MILSLEEISKSFGGVQALSNVSLEVGKGERLGLIGPNGSGKTTLLSIIAGTLRADKGRVLFNGRNVTRSPTYRRAQMGIARSFQVPRPLTSMTVLDNVTVPIMFMSTRKKRSGTEINDLAREYLARVGLEAKESWKPKELTQIDLRKMELARALAVDPQLLLMDETLAGLTSGEVDEVLVLLRKLNEEGIAIVMVEHIMRAVMSFSERLVVLNMGTKIAEGLPQEVSNNSEVMKAYLGE